MSLLCGTIENDETARQAINDWGRQLSRAFPDRKKPKWHINFFSKTISGMRNDVRLEHKLNIMIPCILLWIIEKEVFQMAAGFFFLLYLAFNALYCNASAVWYIFLTYIHLLTPKCHMWWTFSCTRFWKWKSRSHCWYNWSETSKHSCKSLARLSYKEKMSSLLLTTKIAMNCEINGKMISCCYQVSKLFNLQCQSLSLRHFQIHFNIRYIFKHDIILFWKHSM